MCLGIPEECPGSSGTRRFRRCDSRGSSIAGTASDHSCVDVKNRRSSDANCSGLPSLSELKWSSPCNSTRRKWGSTVLKPSSETRRKAGLLLPPSMSGFVSHRPRTNLYAAPDDSVAPFLGKWKLDPAHSRLTDQMKVEAAGPNKYNLIFSGDNVETVVADGTDQPGLFDSTVAIIVQDANNWKVVRKSKGRITITGLWQLSPDGKTLTDNFTGHHANGTTTNLHYIYQRIAGTSGFTGTWESTTEDVNTPSVLEISPFQDHGLSFTNSVQTTQSLEFDGKDYPGSGPDVPAGYASSGHRINERTVEGIDKLNDKMLYTQQIEVSTNGKTLTMMVHIPGRDKPDIVVYDRE